MSNKATVINLTDMSLSIPEVSVRLDGKGSRAVVDLDSLRSSPTYLEYKKNRWVGLEIIVRKNPMPMWPFYKSPPNNNSPPHPSISEQIVDHQNLPNSDIKAPDSHSTDILEDIRDTLRLILEKSSGPTPEVLAAHVAAQISRLNNKPDPGVIHVKGSPNDAPQFIPSTIMPIGGGDVSIKGKAEEISKGNFDAAAVALRALKKKKP